MFDLFTASNKTINQPEKNVSSSPFYLIYFSVPSENLSKNI